MLRSEAAPDPHVGILFIVIAVGAFYAPKALPATLEPIAKLPTVHPCLCSSADLLHAIWRHELGTAVTPVSAFCCRSAFGNT